MMRRHLVMSEKQPVLIIETHSDDSAISISGFLQKYKDLYEYHFVLFTASGMELHHCGFLSREQRLSEYQTYVDHWGATWHNHDVLPLDMESKLDMYSRAKLVAHIEKIVADVEPHIVLCQGPSFHHDHTAVYEALIAATRPTAYFYPHEIYIMENPTYVHSLGPHTDFKPNFYVSLTEEDLTRKIELFKKCFPTQIRESKNYLSENGIRSWARYRGIESRCEYAEALRMYIRII